MAVQSTLLTNFYKAYKAWLDAGSPPNLIFWRHVGLCDNLENYLIHYDLNSLISDLDSELKNQFIVEGLSNPSYPFGKSEYLSSSNTHTMHLDPNRIAWVDKHLTSKYTGETDAS